MNDSSVAALVGGAILSIVTWLYNKARGKKQEDIGTIARNLVDQALHLARVTLEANIDEIRAKVRDYAWQGLAKLNIPRNGATELLVAGAVEAGIEAALAKAREHDRLVELEYQRAAAAIVAGNRKLLDSLKADPLRPLGLDIKEVPPEEFDRIKAENDAARERGEIL